MDMEEFLTHHGIKGMHWGVRKEVVRSSEERVLKKGLAVQNVSAGGSASLDRRLFASYTDKDKLAYQSTYAKTLKQISNNQDTYVNTLTLKKNVKVASEQEAFDAFKELYDKDKPGVIKALAESQEELTRTMFMLGDIKDQKVVDDNIKRYSKKGENWVDQKGYQLFVLGAGARREISSTQQEYYTTLAKRGFDAIVDNTDKTTKLADDPIVFLNPRKSLGGIKTVGLSDDDIKLAKQKYKALAKT